ncbi:Hypothetical_protein [Hexamita inflata]|uniref:Hypothetical_protein n=1 Tax=Hexamita inflata TaxID=28002 RepID=A0AA86R893_9EUKA|nr:Hypothetical protein HINF_LOCUS51115 [Hexamita inflata]
MEIRMNAKVLPLKARASIFCSWFFPLMSNNKNQFSLQHPRQAYQKHTTSFWINFLFRIIPYKKTFKSFIAIPQNGTKFVRIKSLISCNESMCSGQLMLIYSSVFIVRQVGQIDWDERCFNTFKYLSQVICQVLNKK